LDRTDIVRTISHTHHTHTHSIAIKAIDSGTTGAIETIHCSAIKAIHSAVIISTDNGAIGAIEATHCSAIKGEKGSLQEDSSLNIQIPKLAVCNRGLHP
jgi:hypothetical protein